MAYNLQTLITILEQILDPEQTWWTLGLCKPQLESLLEKAASLQKILANPSLLRIQTLESQITKAVHEAENTIESYMVDQIQSRRAVKWLKAWCRCRMPDLQQPMRELDLATEQALKLVELEAAMASWSEVVEDDSSSSSSHVTSSKSVVVGADEDLLLLKDRLTGMERKLEIIPIVGMGGIGKTTLARKLYQDPLITNHFKYARAWATISQDYNMKAILSSLLRCIIGKEFDERHVEKESSELRVVLHQSLYGIRYLIVLDDIWSVKFLDEIRMYFPNNNNGSRIVITTRESGMATYADPESVQHQVQLLSKPQSWNLLRQIVFREEESCPDELQGIGEKIASDCGGLPLAINVVGGLLSKVERSQEIWRNVGKDVRAAIVESDKQFSNILSLSYNHLPNHLKPCFLYMGSAFPEDYQIKASRLVHLWVAEGFVKLPNGQNNSKSLEEEAEDYINALVQRNLVLVTQNKCNGKAKRFTIHDMLRDLCIRKSHDEKFLQVASCSPSREPTFFNPRRVSVGTTQAMENVIASVELMPGARSVVSTSHIHYAVGMSPLFSSLTLLRVLDMYENVGDFPVGDFPDEILQLVNLRYLAINCNSSIPSGISRLCNLQTLIVYLWNGGFLPWDIWEMSELRRVEVHLSEGFEGGEWWKRSVLNKLHSFSSIKLTPWLVQNGILERFPNIKKLRIFPDDSDEFVSFDLSHLHKLETLTCDFGYTDRLRIRGFPSSLRKLTIQRSDDRSMFRTLCRLPNLEVLVVCKPDFGYTIMEQWELEEGEEFGSLQYLRLDSLDLAQWKADETNFPVLRHLVVRRCYQLEEIPSGIGEIPTLELIEMYRCSDSAVASARKIQEEQQSDYGNYNLQLRIL